MTLPIGNCMVDCLCKRNTRLITDFFGKARHVGYHQWRFRRVGRPGTELDKVPPAKRSRKLQDEVAHSDRLTATDIDRFGHLAVAQCYQSARHIIDIHEIPTLQPLGTGYGPAR